VLDINSGGFAPATPPDALAREIRRRDRERQISLRSRGRLASLGVFDASALSIEPSSRSFEIPARSKLMATGYAGVENPPSFREYTRTLLGDAKASLDAVLKAPAEPMASG